MGTLCQVDGTRTTLRSHLLVGRSRSCDLRLAGVAVSGEHASIRWDGAGWAVRDLGSRNGTLVDGRRIEPGVAVPLTRGQRIVFGTPEHTWIVESDGPPVARAVPLLGGDALYAEGGMLALPSEDDPEVVLYARPDGTWRAEGPDGPVPVSDQSRMRVGGRAFDLHLPEPVVATATAATAPLRLPDVRLHFRVSRHEEHVEADVIGETRTVSLTPRAHLYSLLLLARARIADLDRALPDAECGWVDRAELCRMLRTDRSHLKMLFYRGRKQLAGAGVLNPGALIQRRARATEVRLGVRDVVVSALGTS